MPSQIHKRQYLRGRNQVNQDKSPSLLPLWRVAPRSRDSDNRHPRARWYANKKIYDLLVGAIAGAFERSAWPVEHTYNVTWADNTNTTYRYAVDSAHAHFPDGSEMHVSFTSTYSNYTAPEFDCQRFKFTVQDYLDQLLHEIQDEIGTGRGMLYSWAECMYNWE